MDLPPDSFLFKDTSTFAIPRANKTGVYDLALARQLAREARSRKLDPYTVLGMAMQESRFGEADYRNPLRLLTRTMDSEGLAYPYSQRHPLETRKYINERDRLNAERTINESTLPQSIKDTALLSARRQLDQERDQIDRDKYINMALDYARKRSNQFRRQGPLMQIQAYNRLGILDPKKSQQYWIDTIGYVPDKVYGVKGPIDLRKNPLYAKRVQEYANILRKELKGVNLVK